MAGGKKSLLKAPGRFLLRFSLQSCIAWSSFARFQLKQQIATLPGHFTNLAWSLMSKAKSFLDSRIHLRGNWQASAASGHLCLPHLNIALGIYLISFHSYFRNALWVWVLKLSEEFYLCNWTASSTRRSRAQAWNHEWCPKTALAHSWVLLTQRNKGTGYERPTLDIAP